jgi:hypothetical protein
MLITRKPGTTDQQTYEDALTTFLTQVNRPATQTILGVD